MAVARVVVTDPTPILVVGDVERVASGKVLSLEAGVVVSLRDDARLDGVLVDPLHGWQANHWIVVVAVPVPPRTAGGVDHLPFLLRAGDDDLEALLLPPVQALLGHGQLCQTGRPAETGHLGLVIRLAKSHLRNNGEFPLGRESPWTPRVPWGRARDVFLVPGRRCGQPGGGKRAGGWKGCEFPISSVYYTNTIPIIFMYPNIIRLLPIPRFQKNIQIHIFSALL